MMLFDVLTWVCPRVVSFWQISGVWLLLATTVFAPAVVASTPMAMSVTRWCRLVHHELKPFYWPALAATIALGLNAGPSWLVWYNTAWSCVAWFIRYDHGDPDDPDDRWRRRRRRAAERVKAIAGRLVVVPAPVRAR